MEENEKEDKALESEFASTSNLIPTIFLTYPAHVFTTCMPVRPREPLDPRSPTIPWKKLKSDLQLNSHETNRKQTKSENY